MSSWSWGVVVATAVGTACANSIPPTDSGSVTDGSIRFTAETRILESFPVQLHVTVRALNTANENVRLEFPSSCPVHLTASRTAQRRETVWDQSRIRECAAVVRIVDMAPGAGRNFDGQSDGREILGDSLPDGTYHLTAVLHVNGRRIEVPAGNAPLGVPR